MQVLNSYDSVAQLVEQYTFNVWVLGSSPSGITVKFKKPAIIAGFVVYRVLFGAVLAAVPIICNHLQVPGNFLLHFFEKSTACHAKSRS